MRSVLLGGHSALTGSSNETNEDRGSYFWKQTIKCLVTVGRQFGLFELCPAFMWQEGCEDLCSLRENKLYLAMNALRVTCFIHKKKKRKGQTEDGDVIV